MFSYIIQYLVSYSFIENREDTVTNLNNYDNYYIDYFIINHIITLN
jgi:hypothetical protein